MGKNKSESNYLQAGNYLFRVYPASVTMDVKQPKMEKIDGEFVQKGFYPIPLHCVSFREEQFGYGLIKLLVERKDKIALENFGAILFTANSLFCANENFREDVLQLINKYMNPNGEKTSEP